MEIDDIINQLIEESKQQINKNINIFEENY